jgi:hypothetical protein
LKLLRYFRRSKRDEDLASEVESYLAHEMDDNLSRGMTPAAARAAALRKFGNPTRVRELDYERDSFPLIDAARRDSCYAFRQWRSRPGVALMAVVSLALALSANIAIFSLIDRLLLRELPVHNPGELVQFRLQGRRFGSDAGDGEHTFSYPAYRALRDGNTVFSGLTGERVERAGLSSVDRTELVNVGMVAGNYFQVLGLRPYVGRLLTPDDDMARNRRPVAVLQFEFWRSRFGGNPAVVGSDIRLNGQSFTIVGVAARDFAGTNVGAAIQAWVPVTMKRAITPTWDGLDDERYSWF